MTMMRVAAKATRILRNAFRKRAAVKSSTLFFERALLALKLESRICAA
jgi:hypothetical protein